MTCNDYNMYMCIALVVDNFKDAVSDESLNGFKVLDPV